MTENEIQDLPYASSCEQASTVDNQTPPEATSYHVVSHTHWDREWYLPFESFRLRLVDLIDRLLVIFDEYPDYVFYLDAQSICLEDYLEIRPQHRSRLAELIASERLLVGPWYIQNDFHLTSGESTIRNLLIGSEIARDFGRCDKVGYLPDQFGLISQLPQIFNGFGIGNAVFGRGYNFYEKNDDGAYERIFVPAEFNWVSPDDSKVMAVHLSRWYNNAQRFSDNPETAKKYLKHVDENITPFCTTPFRLLMNGVDHLEAQGNLLPILEGLERTLEKGRTIQQSTLQAYLDEVSEYLNGKSMRKMRGELRNGVDLDILQGTLSSRPYLKLLNSRCQNMLELELEPLYSMLSGVTGGGVKYPFDMFRYLWKELLKNHPHDSICGCSVDRVHQDNENRFMRVLDAAEDLKARGIKQLLDRIDRSAIAGAGYLLVAINPLPYLRSEVITAQVKLPLNESIKSFKLLNAQGQSVDFEVLKSVKQNRMTLSPQNLPGQLAVEELTVRVFAEQIPASGYAVYRLIPDVDVSCAVAPAPSSEPQIENESYLLSVANSGEISLTDKRTGTSIGSLLSFEDTADLGDSYCCIPGAKVDLSSFRPRVTVLEKGEFQQSIRLDYNFVLPERFDRSSKERVGEVETPVSVTLTLGKESPLLDISGTIENQSKDHRLRLLVHTMVDAETCVAAQPFDCVERLRYPKQVGLNTDLSQPLTGWVCVRKENAQVSVLTHGIFDYEYLHDEQHSLAVTCVRSTNRIANDPFCAEDNGVALAPEWAAPENQCLRTIEFHVAVRMGLATNAQLFKEQQCWSSPLLCGFDSVDPHKFMAGRPCVQGADLDERFFDELPAEQVSLPLRSEGIKLSGEVVFSAFKLSEDQQETLLRVFNPELTPFSASISSVSHWRELNLDETPCGDWSEGVFSQEIAPKRILTLSVN